MLGIVLAAGYGTRLHPITLEIPKTLIELEPGVTVLDYIVNVFKEVGVDRIYVVTREGIAQHFYGRKDVEVLVVDVVEGDGNLWTLYQAIKMLRGKGVEDDIILSMSDHIYEVSMLKKLIKVSKGSSRLYICLDRLIRGRDAVEGLKIVIDGDTVVLSGKDVPPYSGIDTGLFYIPRNVLNYIEKVVYEKGRKAALSDLINVLSRENLVGYVDVSGSLWQDIDVYEDVDRARKIYWRILAKNLVKDSDGIVSKYLNRRISTWISLTLYKSRIFINPNIITIIVFAIGLTASIAVFSGLTLLGAILITLSSILDGVDGEIARLYRVQTRFGAYLDTLLDRVVDTMFMTAMFYQLLLKLLQEMDPLKTYIYVVLFGLTLLGSTYVSYVSNVFEDKEYIARIRSSFPWTTRDVRLTVLAIATLINRYEAGFMYIAFSSWFFILRTLLHKLKEEFGIFKKVFEFPRARQPHPKPTVKPSIGVLAEEIFLYSMLLTILLYLTGVAVDKVNSYTALENAPLYLFVWQFVCSIEIALIVYIVYSLLKKLNNLFEVLRDKLVEKLWVTPSVLRRIAKKFTILIIAMLSIYLTNFVLASSGIEKDVIDFSVYIIIAIVLVILATLIIDLVKAFEHVIRKRLPIS